MSHAEEYGRPVFAVPGSIYSPTSEGTNELLRTGRARALCTADDVLDTLHIAPGGTELVQEGVMLDALTPNARTVLAELGPKAQTADDLAPQQGLPCRLFWRRSWSWNLPAPPWITAGAGIPRHKGKRPQPQRADMARIYGDITESIRLR